MTAPQNNAPSRAWRIAAVSVLLTEAAMLALLELRILPMSRDILWTEIGQCPLPWFVQPWFGHVATAAVLWLAIRGVLAVPGRRQQRRRVLIAVGAGLLAVLVLFFTNISAYYRFCDIGPWFLERR